MKLTWSVYVNKTRILWSSSNLFYNVCRLGASQLSPRPRSKEEEVSAPPSKNAVSANIKHSKYFHLTSTFCQSTAVVKDWMYNMVGAVFNYMEEHWSSWVIQCKRCSLHMIWNADTRFLLGGAGLKSSESNQVCLTNYKISRCCTFPSVHIADK